MSRLVAADTRPLAELHAVTAAAFADYVAGPFEMTPAQFPDFLARHGIDLACSRVALHGDAVVAFAFVCPRPEVGRWRLGVMAALPVARGTGVAQALLDDVLARAADQGLSWVELECIAENPRALALYRGRGFEVVAPLKGWKLPDDVAASLSAPAAEVREIDRATALAWLAEADRRLPWLPWPNSSRCMTAQTRRLVGWQAGTAQLVFSLQEGTPPQVHSLIDLDPGLNAATVLARALRAAHPDAFAPPILRDDLGGDALRRAGFVSKGLSQMLMRRRS